MSPFLYDRSFQVVRTSFPVNVFGWVVIILSQMAATIGATSTIGESHKQHTLTLINMCLKSSNGVLEESEFKDVVEIVISASKGTRAFPRGLPLYLQLLVLVASKNDQ